MGNPRFLRFRVLTPYEAHIIHNGAIRRPWGACWMVAEGGEGENPLPFSLTGPKRGGGVGGGG